MKHLDIPSGSFPSIEEERKRTPKRRPRRYRNSPSHNSSLTSDDIISAHSTDEEHEEDEEHEDEDEDFLDEESIIKEELIPYAPDGGYGWFIVLAAFLSNFVLDGISVSQSALMEDIRKASGIVNSTNNSCTNQTNICTAAPVYEISVAMYGLISSVLLCTTLVAGPFISLLTTQFGFRKVAMSGSLLASLGIFLSWAMSQEKPNIWAITTFFGGISGVGFGMMFQPSIIIVGIYFEKWRPLAVGLAMMGTGAGTIIFPPLLAIISKTWSWREAYLFQALISLLSASFALVYIPLPERPLKREEVDSKKVSRQLSLEKEKFGIGSMIKSMGPLLTSPTFLLISISGAITMLGFFGPYAFLVDKAMKELKVDEKSATFLLSIIGIANTSGRLIFGLISCHPWVNSLILSNGAITVAGISTMLIPLTTAYYQLVIFCVIFGFCISIITVLRSILVLKLIGMENFNNAFGLSLLFMGIGTLFGNPLGGWLKDSTGTYDISFYAAGGYLLLSAILCYPLQHVRDWENKGSLPEIITPEVIEHERYRQRRYSLSMSLHI